MIMLAHKLDYIAHLPKIIVGNMEENGSTLEKKSAFTTFKNIVLKWTKKKKTFSKLTTWLEHMLRG